MNLIDESRIRSITNMIDSVYSLSDTSGTHYTTTINTPDFTIDRDLLDTITTNTTSMQTLDSIRGYRAQHVVLDDCVWDWLDGTIDVFKSDKDDDADPCGEIQDEDFERLL